MKFIIFLFLVAISSNSAFGLTIEQSMELAYKNNYTLKAQRENLKITNESKTQALSGFLPSITASIIRGRETQSFGSSPSTKQNTASESISINQPIFKGLKTTNQIKKSNHDINSARQGLFLTEADILLETISSHMEIVKNQQVFELNQNNIGVLQENLDSTNLRFKLGEVTSTDVAQSEASLADAISQKIIAEGNLKASLSTYEKLTGFKPNPNALKIPTAVTEIEQSLQQLIEFANKNNPTLKMIDFNIKSAKSNINIEKSTIFPQVDLQADKRRQKGALFSGGADIDTETVQVVVSIPLYQSGAEYSKVRQAKHSANISQINYNEQKQALKEIMTQVYRNYKVAIATIDSNKKLISSFEKSLNGVQAEAKEGARTTLDVLEAEQDLFNAKTNLILSKKDKLLSYYNILALKGDLNYDKLNLNVEKYDVLEHYNKVKYKFIGF